jgi:hypothetical protein
MRDKKPRQTIAETQQKMDRELNTPSKKRARDGGVKRDPKPKRA